MNIGSKEIFEGTKECTAKDYVQDGLIAMWDGIENAGFGKHDANATVWKDLVGSRDWTGIKTIGTFDEKSFLFKYVAYAQQSWQIGQAIQTIEVCGTYQSTIGGAAFFFGGYSSEEYRMFAILTTNNRGFQFSSSAPSMWQPYDINWTVAATYASPSAISPQHFFYNGIEATSNVGTSAWTKRQNVTMCDAGYPFKGKIFCLRLYDRKLSQEEISKNYQTDKVRFGI